MIELSLVPTELQDEYLRLYGERALYKDIVQWESCSSRAIVSAMCREVQNQLSWEGLSVTQYNKHPLMIVLISRLVYLAGGNEVSAFSTGSDIWAKAIQYIDGRIAGAEQRIKEIEEMSKHDTSQQES